MTIKASEEVSNRPRADTVAFSISFGLYVNTIKSKGILINHAINTVIAAAAERTPRIGRGSSKTHAKQQIDDEALEERGRCRPHSVKQILPERRLNLLMSYTHDFIGRFCAGDKRWLRGLRGCLCGPFYRSLLKQPELSKLV
jgi:hypothetical protein